jgi:ribosomal protein L13
MRKANPSGDWPLKPLSSSRVNIRPLTFPKSTTAISLLSTTKVADMLVKKPFFPLEKAVKGMLPKNRLAHKMIKKLILVEGPEYTAKGVTFEKIEL